MDVFAQVRQSNVGSMTQAVLLLADTLPQILTGRAENLISQLTNSVSLVLSDFSIGMKVRLLKKAKTEIFSKLSNFSKQPCMWLPAMENIQISTGIIRALDEECSAALVEFYESEWSQICLWWIPFSLLEVIPFDNNLISGNIFSERMKNLSKQWLHFLAKKTWSVISICNKQLSDFNNLTSISSLFLNSDNLVCDWKPHFLSSHLRLLFANEFNPSLLNPIDLNILEKTGLKWLYFFTHEVNTAACTD